MLVFPKLFGNKPGSGRNPFDYGEDVSKLPPIGHDGPKTLMAIMAHPDDIDFGSSGSIAKWCAEGWTVYYVLTTSGDKGTHEPGISGQQLAAIREEEQREEDRMRSHCLGSLGRDSRGSAGLDAAPPSGRCPRACAALDAILPGHRPPGEGNDPPGRSGKSK